MAYITLKHDGFARGSLVRRVIGTHNFTYGYNRSCASCGNLNRYGSLFEYGWEPDDTCKPSWDGKYFCGKGCRDMYHL